MFFRLLGRFLSVPGTALAVRILLGGVFIWAGAAKLGDIRAFAAVISRYGLVPDELLVAIAFGLPLLEVVAGGGLIFNWRGCLSVVTALLALFIGVLWFGILKGLDIDCGCFSLDEQAEHGALWTAFWRDWLLLGAAGYLHVWRWRNPKPARRRSEAK